MGNQIWQVVRTYLGLWQHWFFVGCWALMQVQMWFASGSHAGRSGDALATLPGAAFSMVFANLFVGFMVGSHLKLQFANPRARLLPSFGAAHLIVAGAIVASATLVAALVVCGVGHAPLANAAGVVLLLITAATCSIHWMSGVSSWLMLIVMFAMAFAPRYTLIPLFSGGAATAVAMLVAGTAALAALGARLWTISEETPEYGQQMPTSPWGLTSRAGSRERRRFEAQAVKRSRLMSRVRDSLFRLTFRWLPSSGHLRGLLLRQAAGGYAMLFAMIWMLPIAFTAFWFGWLPVRPAGATFERDRWSSVMMVSIFAMVFTIQFVAAMGFHRWPMLAFESLLPATRRQFIRDFSLSLACDLALAAVIQCIAIIVMTRLFPLASLSGGYLAGWLALTLVQDAIVYCIGLWLISWRRIWLLAVAMSGAGVVPTVLSIAALEAGPAFWSPVRIAIAAVAVAATVVLLYRLAFRRWCRVEFD